MTWSSPDLSRYTALLLDCDGVLLNGDRMFVAVLGDLYVDFGLPQPDYAERTRWNGPPLLDSAEKLIDENQLDSTPRAVVDRMFVDLAEHSHLLETFPGVESALGALRENDVPLAVATLKLWKEIDDVGLDKIPGLCSFSRQSIFAPQDLDDSTTKAELIAQAVQHLGADPAETLMVGDRLSDIEGAHQAGIAAVGITHTGTSDAAFRKAGALWVGESLHAFSQVYLAQRDPRDPDRAGQ